MSAPSNNCPCTPFGLERDGPRAPRNPDMIITVLEPRCVTRMASTTEAFGPNCVCHNVSLDTHARAERVVSFWLNVYETGCFVVPTVQLSSKFPTDKEHSGNTADAETTVTPEVTLKAP